MKARNFNRVSHQSREIISFFVPKKNGVKIIKNVFSSKTITAIIPTHKPDKTTYRLIKNLSTWYANVHVLVIDDNTPTTHRSSMIIFKDVKKLKRINKNITLLKTPYQHLKSTALNFALQYIADSKTTPEVIITLDDDVEITHTTLPGMINVLFSNKKTGAVCSNAWVKNKKANILTRLQSLEYHAFNITKIGDNGFIHGPLVMQGMLTAFRL